MDPFEPIDSRESSDHSDHRDRARVMSTVWHRLRGDRPLNDTNP
jgi:hypothetical protein